MYAVFQIGSRQYRVLVGQVICIERVNAKIGDQFELNQVICIENKDFIQIGNPFIKTGRIIVTILDHFLDKKIEVIKFRRRKHFRKFQGHRQSITKIKIVAING